MKKAFLLLVIILTSLLSAAQVDIPFQETHYDVHYHWGPVKVNIGRADITFQAPDGRNYYATLDGNTIPWEGRVYCISDTLRAVINPSTGNPSENIQYINGWYMKPKVMEFYSHDFDARNPACYKNILGQGELSADGSTMEAIDVTANMLSLFYFYRTIDFEAMQPGDVVTIPIHNPDTGDEQVRITYNGKCQFSADGMPYAAYDTVFEFSYHGAMSGYPVDCIISASSRIPLCFSASLPIGHVEMIYKQ